MHAETIAYYKKVTDFPNRTMKLNLNNPAAIMPGGHVLEIEDSECTLPVAVVPPGGGAVGAQIFESYAKLLQAAPKMLGLLIKARESVDAEYHRASDGASEDMELKELLQQIDETLEAVKPVELEPAEA